MANELDFALLDDVLPMVAEGQNTETANAITGATIRAVGPLLEYAFQVNSNGGLLPTLDALSPGEAVVTLQRLLATRRFDQARLSSSHDARNVEFSWVPPERETVNAPRWVMFRRRLQNAAEQSGFSSQVAKGLVGAFIEMTDNVLQHSENAASGIGAYRWTRGCFEYAVADAGSGVLASLRSCSDYSNLTDAGTALQTALQEGESRHGYGSGHGNGFRQVLISLTDLSGSLRFRSGDHVLTIDGTSPQLSEACLHHLGLQYGGLFVSVVCRPN